MDKTRQLENEVAKAEDLDNLLDHIAWTDVIYPELQRKKAYWTRALMDTVLGRPMTVPVNGTKEYRELKPEELAGRIDGIDWVIGFFTKTLSKGAEAHEELISSGARPSFS